MLAVKSFSVIVRSFFRYIDQFDYFFIKAGAENPPLLIYQDLAQNAAPC
ncbi:hypothetical protein CHCC20335_0629 [Bacillus paralicheniformis]|nr:hypothetical protein CHCC20335_0629 [Bacillus paralicheniformis]